MLYEFSHGVQVSAALRPVAEPVKEVQVRRIPILGIVVVASLLLSASTASAAMRPNWTVQSTPNPSGAKAIKLLATSCASASTCTAIGSYDNSAGTQVTLAERWNGSSWAIQPTPNPAGAPFSMLLGVSCPTTTTCIAVGGYGASAGEEATLTERWNGSSWTLQPAPATANGFLSAVSCVSNSACTAVGSYDNSAGTQVTLAERWNGSSWAIQPTPNPAGAPFSMLLGVSCPSASACTAVGDYDDTAADAQETLAERWTGSSWAIQPTPVHRMASQLNAVSCPSTSACTAVGFEEKNNSAFDNTLAERWDGTSWAAQSTPSPSGALFYHFSVSCPSTSACVAVGEYDDLPGFTPDTLAERWNGSKWTVQFTPSPAGATSAALHGVSCASPSVCTAVGQYKSSSGIRLTLAERYS